jgi:hypothetical protein
MTTNSRLPLGNTAPGKNRRCPTLNENKATTRNSKEVTPSRELSTLDTTGVRARYRALWSAPGTDPTGTVLAMLREVPPLCAEVDRLTRLLVQARRAYADLAAAAQAALSGHAEGESDPWWYLRDELGTGPTLPPDPSNPTDPPDPSDPPDPTGPVAQPGPVDLPGAAGSEGARWCR